MSKTKKESKKKRIIDHVDLADLRMPLIEIGSMLDRSIPYLIRKAVREWIERNYPSNLV